MRTPTTPSPVAERSRNAAVTQTVSCNFCTAPIVWANTKDTRMPLDAVPVGTGNVLIIVDNNVLTATVLGTPNTRQAYAAQGFALYQHHKLSCPNHTLWSKPGAARPNATRHAPTGGRPTMIRRR